jgi:hypothetical protein
MEDMMTKTKIFICSMLIAGIFLFAGVLAMSTSYLSEKQVLFSSIDTDVYYNTSPIKIYYKLSEDLLNADFLVAFYEKKKNTSTIRTVKLHTPINDDNVADKIVQSKFGFDLQIRYNTLSGNIGILYSFYTQNIKNGKAFESSEVLKKFSESKAIPKWNFVK